MAIIDGLEVATLEAIETATSNTALATLLQASKQEQELYFQGKTTVIGQKHERADIDLQQFVQYCIELSDNND